jgi:Lar family restriction alleviation protein
MCEECWNKRQKQLKEAELCPFCGSVDILVVYDDYPTEGEEKYWAMGCLECQAVGPLCETKEEAIPAWNRRK